MAEYEKYNPIETFEVGDLVSVKYIIEEKTNKLINTGKVTKSEYKRYAKNPVIGICKEIQDNKIIVQNEGIIDVNVTGMVAIDDLLMESKEPGKAKAIEYPIYDEILYRRKSFRKSNRNI